MNDALFITNPTNIRYLTGFVGVENRDAYVLLTKNKTYLFTSALYNEYAMHLAGDRTGSCQVIIISSDYPITKALRELSIEKLEFEADNLTVSEYEKLKAIGVELIPTQNKIEAMRMIKRKDEIDNIRLAAKLTDQCFTYLLNRIRPGITESRLSMEIEGYIRARGGELAFTPIVAFGSNSSQPHFQKSASQGVPLRSENLVLLDFGARVNGYCADMTRVVFLGTPKPEWTKAYETVLAANTKAISLLKNGERHGATLDAAAKEIIAEAGFPVYPHSLGHAVGLDIHEAPRLTMHKDEILKSNMVITVEPGIYLEGSYGIRIEDLILLKNDSAVLLSKSNKNIIIL